MEWYASSIANSLKIDEDENVEKETIKNNSIEESGYDQPSSPSLLQPLLQSEFQQGVKEDISELTETLRSQLWSVASFFAPPPQRSSVLEVGEEDLIAGIRNDFEEIGGSFRTGISKLVLEVTKIASSFLQLGSEGAESKERDDVPESSDSGSASENVESHSLTTNPSPEPEPVKTISVEAIPLNEKEKQTLESKEIQVVDKPVIEESSRARRNSDDDDWSSLVPFIPLVTMVIFNRFGN